MILISPDACLDQKVAKAACLFSEDKILYMQTSLHLLSMPRKIKLAPEVCLTAGYLVVSLFWILLSDRLAARIAGDDPGFFQKIQEAKGILFVAFSGMLLFFFSRRLYGGIKRSYEQKENVEEKFLALNEAAREGIYDYDIAGDYALLNNKMKFFLPVQGLAVPGFWKNYSKRIHAEDVEGVRAEYSRAVQEGQHLWQGEFRLLGKDNIYYKVISNNYIIRDAVSNKPLRIIGAVQDISDLRRLQAENFEQKLKHKRTLAASIIRAQETERNRWAGELHDNVCQILSVANLYASEIIAKPGKAASIAPELKEMLMQSIREIRQLSVHIKSPSFSDTTLLQSLNMLAANINRVNTIKFVFDAATLDEIKLCPEQRLMIYRIVQEQLNNILKYAAATQVTIRLAMEGDEMKISVNDNGKGFDTGKEKTGIGLRNIRSRLQVYNGTMEIKSFPGKGCKLSASFHLSYPRPERIVLLPMQDTAYNTN